MIETYKDLLEALQKLTPEQLAQNAQVVQAGNCDESVPIILQPCISIGTVRELYESAEEGGMPVESHQYVRDSIDGTHKSDSVVLLTDASGYEDDTEQRQLQIARKALQQIAGVLPQFGIRSLKDDALARAALEKMKRWAEIRKEKILKECV